MAGGPMRQPSLCDQKIAPLVEKAFTKGKPRAVALIINSPGGSPVQSSLIAARIRRLASEKEIPVYSFVEDVAASGGYWLAAAGDTIYADYSSIVGSIGVIWSSFGFHEFISRHGIERRIQTAGVDKNLLDPFLPQKDDDIDRLKEVQTDIHDAFINYVKERRGDKLSEQDVFTGKFWSGQNAIESGLVDEIGHLVPVMKNLFGEKVKFNNYGLRRRLFSPFASGFANDILDAFFERISWSRFGL